jgi:hypothetical protein
VEFVLRWPKAVVVAGLLCGGLSIQYAAGNLGINTDTANMISAQLPWRQDYIRYRESFPIRDSNILILIDAASPQQADDFASALASALRRDPDRYSAVFLAGDGEFFERNGLLYLSLPELEALSDRLASAQPLLGLIQSRFNGAGLIEVVATTVRGAEETAAAGGEELAALYEETARAITAAADSRRAAVTWSRLLLNNDEGSARRMILLQPALDFSRIQPAADAIDGIRAAIAQLQSGFDGSVQARLTGTVAMEHEELVSVTRGASTAGISALVLVALVLYWALRSVRLLIVSVVTLLVGLAGTAAFAAAAVGHLNLLSVAFAVLYVGLGVDFILHVCLRLDELRRQGTELHAAVVETIRGVGTSLVICAVTTAAGFYSFIPTPFEGVSELGLISGTGMFISLAVSLTFLPALLVVLAPSRLTPKPAGATAVTRMAVAVSSRPKIVAVAAAAAVVVTFAALPDVTFDSNPIHLRDPLSESIQAIEELAADSEAPLLNVVALAPDEVTAAQWAEALTSEPLVREVHGIDSLVPGDQEDKLYVIEDIGLMMGPRFANMDPVAPDLEGLREELTDLREALAEQAALSAAQAVLLSALEDFAAADAGTAAATDSRLANLEQDLRSDLPRQLSRLADGLQARAFGREDLPPELAARWIGASQERLIEIVPRENVNDNEAAERFVAAVRRVVPTATGLPVVHREASATVVYSFELALTYALIMVTLLLIVFLRSLSDIVLVVVPIVIAAGATAGLTALLGIPFNFANIIALPLLVGVGVDNGIHMVHRMRTEPPRDGEALGTSTSRAVFASGLTTIASFGNLAFSPHVGMASMGQLLTLGMVVTMAATLLLLPALLKLRSGA